MATAEAELQRVEAKLRNETGVAQAQRDFDIKKGAISYFSYYNCTLASILKGVLF